MIKIAGNVIDPKTLINEYSNEKTAIEIINILASNDTVYNYSSMSQFKFEIDMRLKIIHAARQLNDSRFSFRVFKKSKCNDEFWNRTDEGGFRIKDDANPTDAINDIFRNSSMYGTECATAVVIIFCKALIDIYPNNLSNDVLKDIYLMNWQHLNNSMGIEYYRNPDTLLPGDCRYFKNPDVDPENPEWQGENTIDLGNGTYYGHGIGISTARVIIRELNKQRIPNSNTSAFLLDSATRPDFLHLSEAYNV